MSESDSLEEQAIRKILHAIGLLPPEIRVDLIGLLLTCFCSNCGQDAISCPTPRAIMHIVNEDGLRHAMDAVIRPAMDYDDSIPPEEMFIEAQKGEFCPMCKIIDHIKTGSFDEEQIPTLYFLAGALSHYHPIPMCKEHLFLSHLHVQPVLKDFFDDMDVH